MHQGKRAAWLRKHSNRNWSESKRFLATLAGPTQGTQPRPKCPTVARLTRDWLSMV